MLLVEGRDGLVLVDTGFGRRDIREKRSLDWGFRFVSGPRLSESETARAQLEGLGYRAEDVRHVVVTHLDLDHAGGLADFPQAEVHVHGLELEAALARKTASAKQRYLPAQWAHGPRWQSYRDAGEDWFGFEAVRPLRGLRDEIAIVPLLGHSEGHSGVAVRDGAGWLLHAGDAYLNRGELEDPPRVPFGLRLFLKTNQVNAEARQKNVARLAALARQQPEVRIFSSHDAEEFEAPRPAVGTPRRGVDAPSGPPASGGEVGGVARG